MIAAIIAVIGVAVLCFVVVMMSMRRDAAALYASEVVTGRILQLSLEAHQAMLREAIKHEVGRL